MGLERKAALIVLIFFSPLQAQANVRAVHVSGVPLMSCGDYIEARKADPQRDIRPIQVSNWIEGFVTGYNAYAVSKQVEIPDRNTTLAYADKYCRDNPLSEVFSAASSLIKALGGNPAK